MSHWILLPIILPAFLAPFIVLAARYHIGIQRVFSVGGVVALVILALGLAAAFHVANALLFGLNRFVWFWLSAYPSIIWLQNRLILGA